MRMAIGPTAVGWRKFEMTVQNGDILGSLSVGIPCFIMSCPFFCRSFFVHGVLFLNRGYDEPPYNCIHIEQGMH